MSSALPRRCYSLSLRKPALMIAASVVDPERRPFIGGIGGVGRGDDYSRARGHRQHAGDVSRQH
jgi:hypothetical protein